MKNTSDLSFDSSEVSFDSSEVSVDSSEEIFLASVENFHFPPSYSENSSGESEESKDIKKIRADL